MKRTTEIVIERDDLVVVRRREQIVTAWCAGCKADAEMLPPEIAAVLSGFGARELYRLIEAGQFHFTENSVGLLRICARSLSEFLPINDSVTSPGQAGLAGGSVHKPKRSQVMNNERHNKRSLMILTLNAVLLIGVGLILPLCTVNAAPALTTISVQDRNGYVPLAKVTVFNEQNGQQLANGLTDSTTGRFAFQSPRGIKLIVTVLTSTAYLGAARVTPGDYSTIVALQSLAAVQRLCRPATESDQNQKIQEQSAPSTSGAGSGSPGNSGGPLVKILTPEQIGASGADLLQRTGVRSFYIDMPAVIAPSPCKIVPISEFGMPALDAAGRSQNQKIQEATSSLSSANSGESNKSTIAIIEWQTFEQIARGQVNKKDRFSFDIPADMASEEFLTILWSEDGEILLVPSLRSNTSQDGRTDASVSNNPLFVPND